MAERNASINVRVEAEAKEKAEAVFDALGLSMSAAINIYLRQVAMHNKIPFELKVTPKPIGLASLTRDELDAELQKGLDDIQAGRTLTRGELEARFCTSGRA